MENLRALVNSYKTLLKEGEFTATSARIKTLIIKFLTSIAIPSIVIYLKNRRINELENQLNQTINFSADSLGQQLQSDDHQHQFLNRVGQENGLASASLGMQRQSLLLLLDGINACIETIDAQQLFTDNQAQAINDDIQTSAVQRQSIQNQILALNDSRVATTRQLEILNNLR